MIRYPTLFGQPSTRRRIGRVRRNIARAFAPLSPKPQPADTLSPARASWSQPMIPRVLQILAAALLLYACGGGGGGSPVTTLPPAPVSPGGPTVEPDLPVTAPPPEPVSPSGPTLDPDPGPPLLPFPHIQSGGIGMPAFTLRPLPNQDVADLHRIPVYQDTERLLVGIDQTSTHIGTLPAAGHRGDTTILHGSLNDGAPTDAVARYIRQALPNGTRRFAKTPTVRFVGDVSDQTLIDRTLAGIRFVNAALPEHQRIRVPSLQPVARTGHHTAFGTSYSADGTAETNTIYIEFVDQLDGAGRAARWPPSPDPTIDHAYISLKRSSLGRDVYLLALNLVTHELLHALGFEHVPSDLVSIIDARSGATHWPKQPLSILHSLDREALRILYTRLEIGADPTTFGPWASTSVHIAGNGPYANFGVALRNGYAEPWAYGLKPATALSDNPALSGTATWNGSLTGLTPTASSVIGDASIGVNLATMTGTAEFTGLESWDAGTAPGAAGSGAPWLDGDLAYTISVHGNTFRETGGDTGMVTGVFTGQSHEGVAGTLERSDLTAAFGGSR